MSGRMENDLYIENKIKLMIQNQPNVMRGYAQSFGRKTSGTKRVYIRHAINFCTYLQREFHFDVNDVSSFKQLNYAHILDYMEYIKTHAPDGSIIHKEDCSCATEIYAIKHFCKYLKLCRYIDYNPCDEVEVPKDTKNRKIVSLTQDEIQMIKNNILNGVGTKRAKATQKKWINRDMCIVFLGITTGLRVSAIANIDVDDINFEEQYITTIEKGEVERPVYLSDKMMLLLDAWLIDRAKMLNQSNTKCDALFISSEKQRIGTNTIRYTINKYTTNIGKNITPHKLRSTAATNLYAKTGDIYLVANVLGHKNIQNTRRYADVSDTRLMYAADQLSDLI